MHWMNWFGGGWMMIGWWLVIVGIVYVLIRSGFNQPGRESVMEILRKRYAAGEITKDEYERIRETLS